MMQRFVERVLSRVMAASPRYSKTQIVLFMGCYARATVKRNLKMKPNRRVLLAYAVFFVGMIFVLWGVTPLHAQESPSVLGDLALVKYVCSGNVENQGVLLPASCADANNPNGADVPVFAVNGAVSFVYRVNYTCPPGSICASLPPISVTIADNQLLGTTPTEFGPLLDGNGNGMLDANDSWLYKVNGLQAINLSATSVLPNGAPVPSGCAAASDGGGVRPTYVNSARVTGPSVSQEDAAAYCNPLTPVPTAVPTPVPTAVAPSSPATPPVAIPEPTTVILFGAGLTALSAALRARRRAGR